MDHCEQINKNNSIQINHHRIYSSVNLQIHRFLYNNDIIEYQISTGFSPWVIVLNHSLFCISLWILFNYCETLQYFKEVIEQYRRILGIVFSLIVTHCLTSCLQKLTKNSKFELVETLLLHKTWGIQWNFKRHLLFTSWEKIFLNKHLIKDVVINEAVSGWNIQQYLGILYCNDKNIISNTTTENDQLQLFDKVIVPLHAYQLPLHILVKVWQDCHTLFFPETH